MKEIEYNGNKIRIHDDGRVVIVDKFGRELAMSQTGDINMSMKDIRRVGIHNIVDVKSYVLKEVEGLIMHDIAFRDGGCVSFAFTEEGKIERFNSSKVKMQITPQNECVIQMHSSNL